MRQISHITWEWSKNVASTTWGADWDYCCTADYVVITLDPILCCTCKILIVTILFNIIILEFFTIF